MQFADAQIISVQDTTLYRITVNGTDANFNSDADATLAEILAGLVSEVNGIAEPVTARAIGTDRVFILPDVLTATHNYTVNSGALLDLTVGFQSVKPSPSNLSSQLIVGGSPSGGRVVYLSNLPFSTARPPLAPAPVSALTPWNRDLAKRQARIAVEGFQALGKMKMVAGALLFDGDEYTILDGRNPPTTFEFDDDDIVAAGNVPLVFDPSMTEEEVRDLIIEETNKVGASLRVSAFVSPETPGVFVGLVNDVPGELGNQAIIENVSDPGFTADGLEGGAEPQEVGPQGLIAAPEGEHVFCLGYELAGLFHRFAVGDFSQIEQAEDFGATNIVRVIALIRSTDTMPSNLAWRFSLLLDDVIYTSRVLEAGRDRALVDVAANVSKLAGNHTLAFRLDLISV